jgi:hypothetical protein
MARDPSTYREIAVHSVRDPRTGRLGIHPMSGQGFPPVLRVSCSRKLLEDYAEGTRFLVQAKMTDRLGGAPYLYVWHGDPVSVLTKAQAEAFLLQYRRLRL